jgi:predicted DNA-binding transcriptional regulator AlpA
MEVTMNTNHMSAPTRLVSIMAVAARLGVSRQTLRRNMRAWGLRPVGLGRRILLRDDEVSALILRAQGGSRSEAQ